ncbi:N-acetyltransferase [Caldalkalibacillus salinus]|uniref:N-acetyltransferase n=1 Tax=Caldalkalibacillus salinus TaxID=2803787 RepID=UPI001920586B|nr:N-acetyltransferase [Caldalkalibacillus salinus]
MVEIRRLNNKDMDQVIDIWVEGSVAAHDFISPDYWESKKIDMKTTYLPMADTFVIHERDHILGFVSMVDHYLAALFVDIKKQKKGYGKQLLRYIKQKQDMIELKVYQKNKNAIHFYLKNGFRIEADTIDEPTAESEYVMVWEKDKTGGYQGLNM